MLRFAQIQKACWYLEGTDAAQCAGLRSVCGDVIGGGGVPQVWVSFKHHEIQGNTIQCVRKGKPKRQITYLGRLVGIIRNHASFLAL